MKINSIKIKNVLGLSAINIDTVAPVQVFAGPNFAGKSSMQNAIKLALTGIPTRVSKKNKYKMLVRDGQKKGQVAVDLEGEMYGLQLPKGEASHLEETEVLQFVLEPSGFAAISASDRKKLMFEIAGLKVEKPFIIPKLEERECDMVLVEPIFVMLRSGFPAACNAAKDRARDAKSDWKSITGEAWGEDKSDEWEPEEVELDESLFEQKKSELVRLEASIADANVKVGERSEAKRNKQTLINTITALRERSTKVARYTEAVAAAEKMIATQETALEKARVLAGAVRPEDVLQCPHCSEQAVMVDGALIAFDGNLLQSEGDPDFSVQNVENGLASLKRGLADKRSLLADSEAAAKELESKEEPKLEVQGEEERIKAEMKGLSELKKELDEEILEFTRLQEIDEKWEEIRDKAADKREEVLAYQLIAEAFSPEGIMGDMLKEAVVPFNNRLKSSSDMTEWKLARINEDFEIECDGRPYALLSDSEKWRCDAMVAEAISHISGLKILMLDKMDVLDVETESRNQLIDWICDIAEAGQIDTVLVFASLKKIFPDDDVVQWHRIENGTIAAKK